MYLNDITSWMLLNWSKIVQTTEGYPITTVDVLKAKEITDIPEFHDRIIAVDRCIIRIGFDKPG